MRASDGILPPSVRLHVFFMSSLHHTYAVSRASCGPSTAQPSMFPGFVANSKYKIQALFKDFHGPKLHFSSTKIIDKKPHPRRGHSKFRRNVTLKCKLIQVTDCRHQFCIQVLASKLSTNAKFQNMQDLNSRTFCGRLLCLPNTTQYSGFDQQLK